jgi:3-deoxy-manno-octulosonate cytidylyltransferase (CMP-KDO synthetase)
MKVVAIIPARYASTRLPGKPLLDRTGKPLIAHVVDAVRTARRVQGVFVATDDERIARAVEAAGGKVVLTRADHATGTDRLAEAAAKLGLGDDDVIVNVQGDEPEMQGEYIDQLVDLLTRGHASDRPGHAPAMATLAAPLDAQQALAAHNVKVVLALDGSAMYFSRARIPFDRDGQGAGYLLHLGIYAYTKKFLLTYAALPPTPAERLEKLEQLRALENGYSIAVGQVPTAMPGIDTPEDYEKFVVRYTQKH